MSKDVSILPVRPGFINAEDKAALREVGVIVIEVESPSDIRLVRADCDVSAKGMLYAALKGLMEDNRAKQVFTEQIYKQVCEAWTNPPEHKP